MAVLDGEARVLMTAQHIIKALGTSDAMTDDMISVLSKFDHRFSIMNDTKNLERRSSSDPSTSHHGGNDSDSDPEPSNSRRPPKRRVMNSALDSAEKVIVHWDLGYGDQGSRWIFESTTEDSQNYLDAVDEVLTELESMKIHNRDPKLLEEAQHLLQLAMERLEEELRHVLDRYTGFVDPDVLINSFSNGSFRDVDPEEVDDEDEDEEDDEEGGVGSTRRGRTLERTQSRAVALLPAQAAEDVLGIVTRLIAGGFKKECVQVYISSRKQVLERSLQALGVERLSIDEVQRMPWEVQEEKIKKWNQAMKVGVTVLFASEKQLCDQVFAPPLADICFNDFAKAAIMHLLSFGEAIAISRRSPEKLFKILDMYDTLRELIPELDIIFSGTSGASVRTEAAGILSRLGEAARGTFSEFENAIQRDSSRVPVTGGSVHPLTRYVMNYIKLACDYTDTLKLVYGDRSQNSDQNRASYSPERDDRFVREDQTSPLASQISRLAQALQSNLEGKAKMYRDPALTHLFLMNNIHYVVQKVRSSEMRTLLGDIWLRRQASMVRQSAASYQRAAWSKVLACLRDEGLHNRGGVSTGVSRQILKDRFKNFNTIFDEVHRAQSQWVVLDPGLRDELRIFIADKVLPAYRAFLGRYGHHIETGRHPDKYIKYTVEDLEIAIGDFFTGSSGSMSGSRRRSFSLHHSGQ
ncbi:hypothetical protein KC19_4G244800 [Ceratodon purpureus]|uniref:Exocyst subunit Exo70 family protein n=1 Tax=Ceratodon purpureus TaxID=3225 RepID=A0A8T0IEL3_CERPU|nr:hypothetical protein KC19_4G244800 [Ceratodon purpureus]